MAPEINPPTTLSAQPPLNSAFLARVGSLPLVNSALEQAKSLYDTSKTRYQLIDQVETSIKTRVVPQFQPLVDGLHAYDAQFAQIDSYACTGLDMLEKRVPIIKQPADEVLESSRRLVEPILGPVKTVTASVAKSLEDGRQLVVGASAAVDERLKGNHYVADALQFTTTVADRLLGPDAALAVPAGATPFTHAQALTQSVANRLTKQATEHLRAVHVPTSTDLVKAADLVKYTQQRLDEQIKWLQDFVATSQKNISPQLSATAHAVAHSVLATLHTVSATANAYLPESVRLESVRIQALLTEQLAHIRQLVPSDAAFIHRVSEAAETGRHYLNVVRDQLLAFYSANVAQYLPAALSPTASPHPAAVQAVQ